MNKIIIFDLDDTLINTQTRHFEVVNSFCNKVLKNKFYKFEDYVNLKKSGKNNIEILNLNDPVKIKIFNIYWQKHIESLNFLKYDKTIVDIRILEKIKNCYKYKFILLSLRSNLKNAEFQFMNFTFKTYFEEFYFLKHEKSFNPKIDKLKDLTIKNEIIYFFGDTLSDLDAANNYDINFIKVETGLQPFQFIPTYSNINEALIKTFL